jgi:hypothetical protein
MSTFCAARNKSAVRTWTREFPVAFVRWAGTLSLELVAFVARLQIQADLAKPAYTGGSSGVSHLTTFSSTMQMHRPRAPDACECICVGSPVATRRRLRVDRRSQKPAMRCRIRPMVRLPPIGIESMPIAEVTGDVSSFIPPRHPSLSHDAGFNMQSQLRGCTKMGIVNNWCCLGVWSDPAFGNSRRY